MSAHSSQTKTPTFCSYFHIAFYDSVDIKNKFYVELLNFFRLHTSISFSKHTNICLTLDFQLHTPSTFLHALTIRCFVFFWEKYLNIYNASSSQHAGTGATALYFQ